MNNIELNTALLNMGYRYMGIQKDKSNVWGKPIGYVILVVYVTPDMGDIKLSSLCRICKEDGEEMTLTYASTKYSECTKFVPIDNATYNDFLENMLNIMRILKPRFVQLIHKWILVLETI